MIDDFVCYMGKIGKITHINEDGSIGLNFHPVDISDDEIEPVEITHNNMKPNFKGKYDENSYYLTDNKRFVLSFQDDSWYLCLNCGREELEVIWQVKYVNEVQHFLRIIDFENKEKKL